MAHKTIYIDIDGTLTHNGAAPWGKPRKEAIELVKKLIGGGNTIILWSARGERYVKRFADTHGLCPDYCLSKPDLLVDDRKDIRPAEKMPVVSPEEFIKNPPANPVREPRDD